MKLRLEFGHSRSISFPWVLRLCKKFPTFKEFEEDGLRVYSIEVTETDADLASLEAISNRIRGWNQVAYFVNDKLSSACVVHGYIWNQRYKRQRAFSRGDAKGIIDSL
jgi:hypothetical protein